MMQRNLLNGSVWSSQAGPRGVLDFLNFRCFVSSRCERFHCKAINQGTHELAENSANRAHPSVAVNYLTLVNTPLISSNSDNQNHTVDPTCDR